MKLLKYVYFYARKSIIKAGNNKFQDLINVPRMYTNSIQLWVGLIGYQFRKVISYKVNSVRQSASIVINPITVRKFATIFNCTLADRASDSMMTPGIKLFCTCGERRCSSISCQKKYVENEFANLSRIMFKLFSSLLSHYLPRLCLNQNKLKNQNI